MKPKFKLYTSTFLFITILIATSHLSYALPYGSGAFGVNKYSPSITSTPTPTPTPSSESSNNNDFNCHDHTPSGNIRIESISSGDTHLKVKFKGMEDHFNKFEIKWGLSKHLSDKFLGDKTFGDGSTRSYTIEKLTANTEYFIKIRALNGCAGGEWSETLTGKTLEVSYTASGARYNNTEVVDYTNASAVPSPSPSPQDQSGSQSILNTLNKPEEQNQLSTPKNLDNQSSVDTADTSNILNLNEVENSPNTNINLDVKVVDKNGTIIEGIDVTITQLDKSLVTNNNGVARFENIPKGIYEVRVDSPTVKGIQTVNLNEKAAENTSITIKVTSPDTGSNDKGIILYLGIGLVVIIAIVFIRARLVKKS